MPRSVVALSSSPLGLSFVAPPSVALRALFVGACLGSVVVLCAAAPEHVAGSQKTAMNVESDVAPIATINSYEAAPAPKPHIQDAMFEAAPTPDVDASAPDSAAAPEPGIGPKLLSTKGLFQGDGYSYASSQSQTLDARKQPAAGLGLSVPLK